MSPAQIAALSLLGIGVAGLFLVVLGIGAVSLVLALLAGFTEEEDE